MKNTTEPPTDVCDVHTTAQEVDVPNVVGKTQADAKETLEEAGFVVKILQNEDSTKRKGIVLKQSATKAAKGATITITVNSYDGGGSTNTTTNTITNSISNTVSNNTTDNNTAENTTGNEVAEE